MTEEPVETLAKAFAVEARWQAFLASLSPDAAEQVKLRTRGWTADQRLSYARGYTAGMRKESGDETEDRRHR